MGRLSPDAIAKLKERAAAQLVNHPGNYMSVNAEEVLALVGAAVALDALVAIIPAAEKSAYYNIGGAITDIEHTPVEDGWLCDKVSLQTLKRVERFLGRLYGHLKDAGLRSSGVTG